MISPDICPEVWPVWCPCGCGHISDGAPLVPTRSAVVAATLMLDVGRLDTAAFARVMRRSHPFYALVFSHGGEA